MGLQQTSRALRYERQAGTERHHHLTLSSVLTDPLKQEVSLSNGRFCNRCKQVGHIEQYYKINKNKLPNVSSIKFNSCYMLFKCENGVKGKFIGTPIVGPNKKAVWVPKTLVTNLQGSKQVWVPIKN